MPTKGRMRGPTTGGCAQTGEVRRFERRPRASALFICLGGGSAPRRGAQPGGWGPALPQGSGAQVRAEGAFNMDSAATVWRLPGTSCQSPCAAPNRGCLMACRMRCRDIRHLHGVRPTEWRVKSLEHCQTSPNKNQNGDLVRARAHLRHLRKGKRRCGEPQQQLPEDGRREGLHGLPTQVRHAARAGQRDVREPGIQAAPAAERRGHHGGGQEGGGDSELLRSMQRRGAGPGERQGRVRQGQLRARRGARRGTGVRDRDGEGLLKAKASTDVEVLFAGQTVDHRT